MQIKGVPNGQISIGIITYDCAHLKTEQLVQKLLLRQKCAGQKNIEIKIVALPFSTRRSREVLFRHRPDQSHSVPTRDLARSNDLEFVTCTYDSIPNVADYYLVAGAGILTSSAIAEKKIINAHPGIIPFARGLDAFKWSILNGTPLGITLHYIDAQVDSGDVITVVRTPIFYSDTIEILARRHYEVEIDLLADFYLLHSTTTSFPIERDCPEHPPNRRMPLDIERKLLEKFDQYKAKFSGQNFDC